MNEGGGEIDASGRQISAALPSGRDPASGARRVAYLDPALWRLLTEAEGLAEAAQAWLLLQFRMIDGASAAALFLAGNEAGDTVASLRVAAVCPDDWAPDEHAVSAAETALREGKAVVRGRGSQDTAGSCVAYPYLHGGRLVAIAVFRVSDREEEPLREIVARLRWGGAWLDALVRRDADGADRARAARAGTALDLVATVVAEEEFDAAALAAVTEMAVQLDCERVALGFATDRGVRIAALSHSADVNRRMNLSRRIAAAMDEAVDQDVPILYPDPAPRQFRIATAHAELARGHGPTNVLTIPFGSGERPRGAVTFERVGRAFSSDDVELADAAAAAVGSILDIKRRDARLLPVKIFESATDQLARLLGRRHYGRKLAVLAIGLTTLWLSLATREYSVHAPAALEGLLQRTVVAPYDGYVSSEAARAGDVVEEGQVLATLKDLEPALERQRWLAVAAQRRAEFDRVLSERDIAESNLVRAQIEEAEAEIALLDERIARAQLRAPFDGVLVSGDLRQSIGAPVERGEVLFRVAPLSSYRVVAHVDDTDVRRIAEGAQGSILLAAIPDEPIPFTVEVVTPISEAREGRNTFRVEGRLDGAADRLLPGMEGTAKIDVGERKLVWIWTHGLVEWLRLQSWNLWP